MRHFRRYGPVVDVPLRAGPPHTPQEQHVTEINGSTSDGFHTFDELYHHRTVLAAMLLNQLPGLDPWKSRLHDDGTMFDGFFIVGADTMDGQATYHCRNDYWDLFSIEEVDRAPAFDGHSPEDTLRRLFMEVTGRELEVSA